MPASLIFALTAFIDEHWRAARPRPCARGSRLRSSPTPGPAPADHRVSLGHDHRGPRPPLPGPRRQSARDASAIAAPESRTAVRRTFLMCLPSCHAAHATRNPIAYEYVSGGTLWRWLHDSMRTSATSQPPPLTTRSEPLAGPSRILRAATRRNTSDRTSPAPTPRRSRPCRRDRSRSAGYDRHGVVPAAEALGRVRRENSPCPGSRRSPHGYRLDSAPPRADFSHSASVGSRNSAAGYRRQPRAVRGRIVIANEGDRMIHPALRRLASTQT